MSVLTAFIYFSSLALLLSLPTSISVNLGTLTKQLFNFCLKSETSACRSNINCDLGSKFLTGVFDILCVFEAYCKVDIVSSVYIIKGAWSRKTKRLNCRLKVYEP